MGKVKTWENLQPTPAALNLGTWEQRILQYAPCTQLLEEWSNNSDDHYFIGGCSYRPFEGLRLYPPWSQFLSSLFMDLTKTCYAMHLVITRK